MRNQTRHLLLPLLLLVAATVVGADKPHHLNLSLTKDRLAVCQLPADASVPAWASSPTAFTSISRTSEELSIVCPETVVPAGIKKEPGWRIFKVDGPLDFALTGILTSVADPLAKAHISIFAISTYNTDYVLVKDEKADSAVKVLKAAGHKVRID